MAVYRLSVIDAINAAYAAVPIPEAKFSKAITEAKTAASFPCWRRDNEAEAYVVVPVVRVVPVAIRRAQVPGVVVPGAATVHAVGAAFEPQFHWKSA